MILKDSAFILQRLPWDCEPTILGDLMGANQQYRGPKGLQVRQYGNLLIGPFWQDWPPRRFRWSFVSWCSGQSRICTRRVRGGCCGKMGKSDRALLTGIGVGLASLPVSALVSPNYG